MNGTPANLEQQLLILKQQYSQRLEHELLQLQALLAQFSTASAAEWQAQAAALVLRFHTLAGSAGTFGFTAVGVAAKNIEQQLKSLSAPPGAELHAQLQQLFVSMQQGFSQPIAQQTDSPVLKQSDKQATRIVLLCNDPAISQPIGQTLKTFGHQIDRAADFSQLMTTASENAPDLIIVDLDVLDDRAAGLTALNQLQCPLAQPIPLFVLTSDEEFCHYLQAVRAGVVGYFVKPLNPAILEARLQRLLSVRERDPFRVLIVDDDQLLAQHYALVLQTAGLRAEIMTNPAQVFPSLRRFHPDVILLDVHMPECSGPELAQVIRLQDEWLGIPIIYLSSETDSERQMASLIKAGDDFLTKPISDNALVVAIFARAQRARQLAEVMTKDSLTGLLQHAHIKERLNTELERAARLKQHVSVAMLDIDHFKKVNDVYGHLTGDQVISSLANLLRQQLRKTDLIGRYGGEEFLLVLPDCQLDKATLVINQLREAFARIPFISDGQTFHCTFSAGIASGSASQAVDVVIDFADQALYQAKAAGRNQVSVYQATDGPAAQSGEPAQSSVKSK